MLKKHTFSPNHKVVAGPHNFNMPGGSAGPGNMSQNGSTGGGSAEPAGGGAQGPSDQSFADGGEPKSSTWDNIVSGAKDLWNQATSTPAKSGATANPVKDAQGAAQRGSNRKVDDAERQAVNGDDS